jgi:CrcB protein
VGWWAYVWIAVGSALGGMARYWLTGFVAILFGVQFPWGTILINVMGSFVIGFFATLTAHRWPVPFELRAFVMVGLCGGFTTFSAFSLQTLELARFGRWLEAGGNVLLSVVLCLIAVWFGHALAALLGGVGPAPGAD